MVTVLVFSYNGTIVFLKVIIDKHGSKTKKREHNTMLPIFAVIQFIYPRNFDENYTRYYATNNSTSST
jgi:hypothetical protein